MTGNPQNHIVVKQSVAPKFLIFSGKTSEMIKNGKLEMPQAATNEMDEKLTNGIQLYASTP